ncbi:hypothetical protein Pelo_19701 [Pelomyxa schiedti]|nr:hypothetical protein Pelo_19701 [Pelomyxa schiedti]
MDHYPYAQGPRQDPQQKIPTPPTTTFALDPAPNVIILNFHPAILQKLHHIPDTILNRSDKDMMSEWPILTRRKQRHPANSDSTRKPKTSSAPKVVDSKGSKSNSGNTSTTAIENGSEASHSKKRRVGSPKRQGAKGAKVSCPQLSAPDIAEPSSLPHPFSVETQLFTALLQQPRM